MTIRNSTLSGNSSPNAGDIVNFGDSGTATVTIGSTIIKAGSSSSIANSDGTVTSLGYNLSSDGGVTNSGSGTGALNATGDQTSTNPMLGPLGYYGGPTATHILQPGSPAIDKGNNFTSATTDQRGPGFVLSLIHI